MTRVVRLVPPLALMGVIWGFSAQPDLSSGLGDWDLLLRKLAHMAEFGVLWLLWLAALGARGLRAPHPALLAAALALGWAAIDEVHQTGVEGRHGTPVDVLIDGAGIALAWLAWHHRFPSPSRRRRPPSTSRDD